MPGFVMVLRGDNYLEEEIIRSGQWEPSTTQFIRRTLQPGMTVVDVGANIGYFSLLMASLVGPEGEVHAFEPYPGYIERMHLSLAVNSFEQIYLNKYALSDKKEQHELFKGIASARMHRWSHPDAVFNKVHDKVIVSCIPFDEYASKNFKKLDLIKIDVDGYEMNVLRGALASINRYRPIIIIELYEEALNDASSSASEVLELFSSWSYLPYTEKGELFRYNELLSLVTQDPKTSVNVVFRPEAVANKAHSLCATGEHICKPLPYKNTEEKGMPGIKLTPQKPRILFLAVNFDNWVASTIFHEQEAISRKMQGSIFYGPGYRYDINYVPDIIKETFGFDMPDAIFCYINEHQLLGEPMSKEIISQYSLEGDLRVYPRGLRDTSIPKIAWINDFWHCSRDEWDEILLGNGFEIAFCTYCPPFVSQQVFNSFFSRHVQEAVRFVPWPRAINPEIFKDYGVSKDYDVTLLGAMDESFYPLRTKMHREFSKQSHLSYFSQAHPGYQFFSQGSALTGEAYAKVISRSRIFASCTSKYKIPFIKLYEILACQTMLMCDRPTGAEYLGLKEGENYVEVSMDNFLETTKRYLNDHDEIDRIAKNGRDLFLARHTVDIRADEFSSTVSDILNGKTPGGWAEMFPQCRSRIVHQVGPVSERTKPIKESKLKKTVHITDVTSPADKQTLTMWFKYGVNSRPNENPPVVTEFPELVVLRGVYLRQLAEQVQAKYMAEVGTARGFQSFMWAQYLIDAGHKDAIVYTCDVDGMDAPIYKTSLTGDRIFTRRQLWADTPQSEFVRFIHGDSTKLAQSIANKLDILYIDGQHTEEAVELDFQNLSSFLHSGSLVVFDDCDERFPGIQKAVKRISSLLGAETQIIEFAPHRYKIAVMKIPQDYVTSQEKINEHFEHWFSEICIKSILDYAKKSTLIWQGRPLEWEACHEIMAYHEFSKGKFSINELLRLSNDRYKLLDELWPGEPATKESLYKFYRESAKVLPWGHGVFVADHNVAERRKNWLRRVKLLEMLKSLGVDSIVDYGAGGGHTTLLAKAMGFSRVIHHEYDVFSPYVLWRASFIHSSVSEKNEQQFLVSDASLPLNLPEPVQAVICTDVAEHVWDPDIMLEEIRGALSPDGYLVWNAMFGENISCHLHSHLQGKEERLLASHGFKRVGDLPADYLGHSGLYRLHSSKNNRGPQPQSVGTQPNVDGKQAVAYKQGGQRRREECELLSKDLVSPSKTLPRVLFIVDSPGWAHDFKADNLMRVLANSYDMHKCYKTDVTPGEIDRADLVVVFYWKEFTDPHMKELLDVFQRNKHKLLLGICSHYELEGNRRDSGMLVLKNLPVGVFVNNLFLYREFSPVFEVPVFYTPNGVDTEFFTPGNDEEMSRPGSLRVGWAGSLTNQGNKRGYHDFIVPAVNLVDGVELVTAAREQKWRNHHQIREFYRPLDVYICASRTEGTPNPCLEASACGVPPVTTRVGNMPELVEHGVNGFFIERDVKDIVDKLILLRDNLPLRQHLSRSMLLSIREWDWRYQAENYRVMFDSILSARNVRQNKLFKSTSQLYLASADRMDCVLSNVSALNRLPSQKVGTFATVIGGLSGLNYLLNLEPRNITFFDINLAALSYARLIVEMISISNGPEQFVSRMFSRRVDELLNRFGQNKLTVDNQKEYLEMPIDKSLLAGTLSLLSDAGRNTYKAFVGPHLPGKILGGVKNCRRLLPCWPVNERVPVGGGEALGWNEQGQLVPNTNTFFYGCGWLASEKSFNRVKQALNKAKVCFLPCDLLKQDLRCLGDLSGSLVLHASNMDDWFREKWVERVNFWVSQSLVHQGSLSLITTNGGVQVPGVDPHMKAFAGLRPYVFGRIVEVTHKAPWGFHEFERTNVTFDNYLVRDYPADTTILHILIGEGVSRDIFSKVYEKAVKCSRRVIVLEHNRQSSDWKGRDVSRFVSVDEMNAMIEKVSGANRASLTCVIKLAGETDSQRNIMFVVDCSSEKSLNALRRRGLVPMTAKQQKSEPVVLEQSAIGDRYALGSSYLRAGRYSEAQITLEPILESLTQHLKCGRSQLSGRELNTYNNMAECYLSVCTKLAQCYVKQGKYDKVKQIYSHLLKNQYVDLPEEQKAGIHAVLTKLENIKLPAVSTEHNQPNFCDAQAEPLVSVIMPAYNAADYITKAIESVLMQSYKNFELIVVDDGSTDQTKDLVLGFKGERIRYFYQENSGLASSHNKGIKESNGAFTIKLDSDDMMTPDFIARHIEEFEKHPEADLVYCDDCLIDENDNPVRVIERPEYTDRKSLIRDLFRCGFPVVPFRTCIRRSVFDKVGFFDEDLLVGEDYDMMRRFVKHGLKIHHLKGALYLRRMTPTSLSRDCTAQKAKAHFDVVKRFIDTFSCDELFPDVEWDKIAPDRRQLHTKCLAAVTCLAIGRAYVKSNSAVCAEAAFEQACSQLSDCLKVDPGNRRVQQLLQKSELARARCTETVQQAVC